MSALVFTQPAVETFVEPGFEAILALVAETYSMTKEEVRTGADDTAGGARDCFMWLCDQIKTRGTLAAASFIGVALGDAAASVANVERQRATDEAVRHHTDELALTLHCEAVVMGRLGLRRADAPQPEQTARRILSSRRAAGLVGIEDLQALAAAFCQAHLADNETVVLRQEVEALRAEVQQLQLQLAEAGRMVTRAAAAHPLEPLLREFVLAAAEVERAFGPYERTARTRFDRSCQALSLAGEKHFHMRRKFK